MALTVNLIGRGLVHQIDAVADVSVVKHRGSGGTPSAALADSYKQKTSAVAGEGAVTVTVNKTGIILWYDIGAGNELDYTPSTGANEGEMVSMWSQFLAAGILANQNDADGGYGVALGTSVTNYDLFSFFGGDTTDIYSGGWTRFVVDPTKTASVVAGTGLDHANVRYFGVFANVGATTARFDNLILDRIDSLSGVQIEGTSTDFITDILALENTEVNQWGIFQALNTEATAIEIAGAVELGDNTSTVVTTIDGADTVFFSAAPQYYNGTSVVNSVPDDFFKMNIVGNATGATTLNIGIAVGSDAGRNGWTINGNDKYTFNMDFDDGNVDTNNWYGCNFNKVTGSFSWGTNTTHKLFSANLSGCNQFDPVGAVQLRNVNFVGMFDDGTADASNNSALLWNSSIDIASCNFLANSHTGSDVAHGIEHDAIPGVATGTVTTADATGVTLTDSTASFLTTAAVNDIAYNETDGSYATVTSITSNTALVMSAGLANGTDDQWDSSDAYSITTPVTYTDLVFSGNEKDIHNSTADALVISKSGASNPATSTGIAVFQGSVTVEFTVLDKSNAAIENAQVSAYLVSDDSEVVLADTNASGVVSTSYAGATPVDIYYRIRKASPGDTKYINDSGVGTIASGTGFSVTRTLTVDTNNNS